MKVDTKIGNNCFIGINSIIMPGVTIGNEVIIGAGSVVTKNIPDNCIAAGNPAKIIKTGIRCEKYGYIVKSQ
jgi:acetyltransferase-like isoleucine patch superfamily enzyme